VACLLGRDGKGWPPRNQHGGGGESVRAYCLKGNLAPAEFLNRGDAMNLDQIKRQIEQNPPRAMWLPALIEMLERDARRLRDVAKNAELRITPDDHELVIGFPARCRKRALRLENEAALYRECIATGWTR
jgi:hypothetical protein